MSVDQASTFLSLLALVAAGITVAAFAALATPGGRVWLAAGGNTARGLAFAVAATSTAGSLYYSEVAHFTPCELCWYQRIAMYPLAVLLGTALLRRRADVAAFVLPLAVGGAAVSAYHYQLQAFPDQGSTCEPGASCAYRWVEQFGFISIPLMALAGFAAVAALVLADRCTAVAGVTRDGEAA